MTRPEITAKLSAMIEKKIDPHNDPRIYWAKEVTFDYSTGHAFERPETDRTGKYICKKCGCSEDTTWISGYNRGIEHTKADAEKYKLALFAVIRNSKVLPKGLILGKSATEINKMSRETMDEVLKSLDFEKIRGWYDGEEVKSE
ncbi:MULTISPECIES: hypothetical protein [unclassified Blautia]|uniref:hypothetical protein n=1 Tax=unclassified Blautia TaxID=2648079 RepID=UPI003F8CA35F